MNSPAENPEPRWPAGVALLAVGGVRLALPKSLAVGPNWILLVIVIVLLAPLTWARHHNQHRLNKVLGYVLISLVTVDMVLSLCLLIAAIPSHTEPPQEMLRSARLYGLRISWYLPHGIGDSTLADLTHVNLVVFTLMAHFCFRKCRWISRQSGKSEKNYGSRLR